MLKRFIICVVLILFFISNIFAQNNAKKYADKIYKKGIKSVVIHNKDNELLLPAIELNSDDKIILRFDELGTTVNDYAYSVVHCNADWQESNLMPLEYISGFNEVYIRNHKFSQNTMVNYVNYTIEFPDTKLNIKKSGNYIVKIYERNNPDNIILTKKFYVYENLTKINAKVDLMNIAVKGVLNQRINIDLTCVDDIENPAVTVFVKVQQNGALCKNFKHIKPTFVSGNKIKYIAEDRLAFAGGNEFRHFDIKNFKFISDRIYNTEKTLKLHHVYLLDDLDLQNKVYKFKHDINGKRTIKLERSNISEIMADYGYVYFRLNAPIPLQNGEYYIYGALTDWQLKEEAKLNYNAESNLFEGNLFLKQGYYNYHYIFKSADEMFSPEESRFLSEGNHFQTENEYLILVYYKSYGSDYEQLIGYKLINSTKTANY